MGNVNDIKSGDLTEKTVSENLIFDGKVLHVYCDEVLRPDGKTSKREYAKHNGAVCVVPLTDEGEVICVTQYRYAVHKMLLEIPAGKLDYVGEDRRDAALRELREETGALCESLTYLGDILTSPAIVSERISMYLAEGLSFTDTDYDDGEFINIVKLPLAELVDMIIRGEVEDAKTQAAVLKVKYLRNL